jgi:hypothetical protein
LVFTSHKLTSSQSFDMCAVNDTNHLLLVSAQ